jgi:D-ribose pyranose/furanose isomerase RbsD
MPGGSGRKIVTPADCFHLRPRVDSRQPNAYVNDMVCCRGFLALGAAFLSLGCAGIQKSPPWHAAVDRQAEQLGYRNWIVIAEASFPAQNRPGIRQVTASVEVPEALDYVLNALEQTENVRSHIYLPRELRSVENDFAPGIDELRKRLKDSLHGHEAAELEQQSLLTLLEDANRSFDVLVIRTTTALPYSSVFLELQPGYWDVDSETRLREKMERERMQKIVRPR